MDAHKNFAASLVATAPSPPTTGTSLVVTAGQGALFPAVPFNAVIWPGTAPGPTAATAEVVRVTARSTDTLTITRAQESTSARTVVAGDKIANAATAKVFTDIETELVAMKPAGIADGETALWDSGSSAWVRSTTVGEILKLAAAGMLLGGDTTLYRALANTLKTDGGLIVGGDFDAVSGRLGQVAKSITDWDNALDNGWYMGSGAANAPAALTGWVIGEVIAHGATGYRIQSVFDFTAGTGSQVYERRQYGGTWGAWIKLGLRSTDGALYADGTSIWAGTSVVVDNENAAGRLYFGSALDTSLYRAAADTLKTDDSLAIGGGYGTSLPASPVDGQIAFLVDSLTAPTYCWQFRYVSGVSDANKWVFIGGSPVVVETSTDAATSTTATYSDPATVVSFTVPRAGVYLIEFGATFANLDTSANFRAYIAPKIGAAATADADAAVATAVASISNPGGVFSVARALRKTCAASDLIKLQGRGGTTTASTLDQFLKLIPVRVA
jgi:hypothetical protein